MNTTCPQCQAELELPSDSHGKKARCPSCSHVFVVGGDEAAKQVQPGLPAAPTAPGAGPESKPRARRYDEDDDLDTDIGSLGRDSESVAAQAKAATRSAGNLMLVAAAMVMLNFVVGIVMFFLTIDRPEIQAHLQEIGKVAPGLERAFPVLVPACVCVFYAPFLLFMLLGARSLLALKSRGVIITGVVFSFIMVFLEAIGLIGAMSSLAGQNGMPNQPVSTTIINLSMTLLCFAATLAAAIMSIRALSHPDVVEYYRCQFEEELDRRRRR